MCNGRVVFVAGMIGFWAGTAALAYNAPEDTAGPVTVRIEGPARVTERSTSILVVLLNSGEEPASGVLRIGVVDAWRVTPETRLAFALGKGEETRFPLELHAGEETYNAHYPVHAWASFESGGRAWSAHAVLIFEAGLTNPPQATRAVSWEPVVVARDTRMPLWRLPIHRTVISVFHEETPQVQPVAWQGSDGRTRTSIRVGEAVDRGGVRRAISVHPPWYEGLSGTAILEFPLALPESGPIRLSFANAIRDTDAAHGEPSSDGVTFRVRVASMDVPEGGFGEVLFERHTAAKVWEETEVDLSAYAGHAVRVQLETHPGPKHDTTCDQAFWGDPVLVSGTPPPGGSPSMDAPSRLLGVLRTGRGDFEVRLWQGQRGLLDATIGFFGDNRSLVFQGFRVCVAGDGLEEGSSISRLLDVREEAAAKGGYRLRHHFEGLRGAFDLVGELWVEEGALHAAFALENGPAPKPWDVVYLEDVSLGSWNSALTRVYAGQGNVIERPEAFSLPFDGHQLATSFVGYDFENGLSLVQAVDVPPERLEVEPATRHYTLHTPHAQIAALIPCANVWDGVKVWRRLDGRAAAGGVADLAGRFVFDLWGGRYGPSAVALEKAFRYGLSDAMVVWHNWQRWGYDYRLPDIWPPNPQYGTEEEFVALAAVCKKHGVLFAPHDNYIDFYPDAEGYSYRHMAFTESRTPVRAWLNEGREAQSYRWRPDAIQPFVERNIERIHGAAAPTAYFIDVFSSIRPYDYWTNDGEFHDCISTRNIWGETFAWIRDCLGGNAPQVSESGHDQLIGWLDGAQANQLRVDTEATGPDRWFVWYVRCQDAERIPWFDAAYHDRFILHGAGYDPRYRGGLAPGLHGIYSDDYMATEILSGRPGMVPSAFGRDVVRKYWLLQGISRGLALARIEEVSFDGGDIHRQHVRWSNGGEVWLNRGDMDWWIAGHCLPPYGFYAHIELTPISESASGVAPISKSASGVANGIIEAAIERLEGHIVEWSCTGEAWYVNGRLPAAGDEPVAVKAAELRCLGGRKLELRLEWKTARPLAENLTVFVHGVDAEDTIRFQGDHVPNPPTSQWKGTVTSTTRMDVPGDAAVGTAFHLYAGLYAPASGARRPLGILDDGQHRVKLGTITLEGQDGVLGALRWTPWREEGEKMQTQHARMNSEGVPVDFGGVATAGGCRLRVEDGVLALTPLPDNGAFEVRINWPKLPWALARPRQIRVVDERGKDVAEAPAAWDGDVLVLPCEKDVFEYRLAPMFQEDV